MRNIFKKQQKVTVETMVETIPTKNSTVIEEIHNSFNIAGERLVKEAEEIIASLTVKNEDKAKLLERFGFSGTQEVVEYKKTTTKKIMSEVIADALKKISFKYPTYKFITKGAALEICEKYNLVIGNVGQFKGFVPQKNLLQIEEFFKNPNELNTFYTRSYSGSTIRWEVTEEEYKVNKERIERYLKSNEDEWSNRHCEYYTESPRELQIAAPLKQMDGKGYKLAGRIFEREIPDPVVLAPIKVNDIQLYCIVTAWGEEASDEIVVNQKNN